MKTQHYAVTEEWFSGDHPNAAHPQGVKVDPRRRIAWVPVADVGDLPRVEDRLATDAPRNWIRWTALQRQSWCREQFEQREREAWRRLLLLVKAKLEVVAEGVSTFEREFLPDILLPDGSTVYQMLAPQLEQAYESGDMPSLLPEGS